MNPGHLSREQMLAMVEAASWPADPHLEVCDACRTEVRAVRRVLDEVRAVDVPEPSPLFWSHLSRRIHDAVVEEAAHAPDAVAWRRWVAWASPLATAVMIALVLLGVRERPVSPANAVTANLAGTLDEAADPDWQLLLEIVGDEAPPATSESDASVVQPRPGTADAMIAELSGDERAALVSLLRNELGS